MSALLLSQGINVASQAGNAYSQTAAMRGAQQASSAAANINADWRTLQEADALKRGAIGASRERLQGKQIDAAMRVDAANRGVDPNSGSAAAVRSDQRLFADLAGLDARQAAYKQALGLRSDRESILGRDKMNRLATKNQIRNTLLQTGMNVAGTGLRSYAMYERYKGLGGAGGNGFDYSEQEAMRKTKADWRELD